MEGLISAMGHSRSLILAEEDQTLTTISMLEHIRAVDGRISAMDHTRSLILAEEDQTLAAIMDLILAAAVPTLVTPIQQVAEDLMTMELPATGRRT